MLDLDKITDGTEPYEKLESFAEFIDVRPPTIYDWMRKYPTFPHLRLPGTIRVRRTEVIAWLEEAQFDAKTGTVKEKETK
jgi:predicted DNA-binding transcriptional regulator AlpA